MTRSTARTAQAAQPARGDEALRGLLGYRIRRAWLAMQTDLVETLRPFDLRILTFTALALVRDNAGLSQSHLAALMSVERPNLVSIVDELERRGLVTRDRDPSDGRAYALHLTGRGAALCADATEAVVAHEARFTAGLSKEARATVEQVLTDIRRRADEG